MEGRYENEAKTKARIEEIVKTAPHYIRGYWYSIFDSSYTTQYRYIRYVLDFINYLSSKYGIDISKAESLSVVKPSIINTYLIELEGCKNGIKASRFYGIKSLFNYLVNDDYVDVNPCNKLKPPKDREMHEITSLTKNEIKIIKKNILNGCGTDFAKNYNKKWVKRDYAIVILGLSLGLRVTSISEINLGDINFDSNEIKIVEKGNKTRLISFSDNVASVILEWLKDRDELVKEKNVEVDALFISTQMKRISSKSISRLIEKYTYNIDKKITPHKLRSTCATNVYNSTGDIYLTANILGHANIANTRRYAKVDEERKKKAAQAMDKILF